MCSRCGSLARHRVLWSYLLEHGQLDRASSILHFAPEPAVQQNLARLTNRRYVTGDLDAHHDLALDITVLPFPDDAFDLVLCCHVLEHIVDDSAAMQELARVTRSRGVVLVQVPWQPDAPTDEAPEAPPDERVRRFGQADHVRMYGGDIVDRLEAAGLTTQVVPAASLARASETRAPSNEAVFVGRPAR